MADEHLDTHVSIFKEIGSRDFLYCSVPANAAKSNPKSGGSQWHPVFITNYMASSIATALKACRLGNALGVITAAFLEGCR